MTDREKVIKTLQGIRIALDMDGHHNDAQAVADALALLKEQEPRVLTLEEALKANPVWFETHGLVSPAIIDHGESKAGFCVIVFGEDNWNDYPISQYNKTWRCWTSRPTDEQRKAVKWDD